MSGKHTSRSGKRKETVPAERGETVRQEIRTFLEGPPATIREISQAVRASEKEVLGHLEHLEKSVSSIGSKFIVSPAECEKCGFVFKKRKRLKKPSRCPLCRSETVSEPLFSVRQC
jgi:predicted Zn-ribbon and HTH transcriptional regulator